MPAVVFDRLRLVDLRSLEYPVEAAPAGDAEYRSRTWADVDDTPLLDQGNEGACTGHAAAHELAAIPAEVDVDSALAFDLYHEAQHRDPWPGCHLGARCPRLAAGELPAGQYEGSSITGTMLALRDAGWIDRFLWPQTFPEAVLAVGRRGPLVCGIDWTEDMSRPDDDGFVRTGGRVVGGHAVEWAGVKIVLRDRGAGRGWENVDPLASYAEGPNSWGRGWGDRGWWRMSLAELATRWPGGDFALAQGRHAKPRTRG